MKDGSHCQPVAQHRLNGDSDDQKPRRRRAPEALEARHDRWRSCVCRALEGAPCRLLEEHHHDEGQQDTRCPDGHQSHPPAELLADRAAHDKPEDHPDIGTEHQDRHRRRSPFRRIVVGDDRLAGRVHPGLTDTNADTEEDQGDDPDGKATEHGEHGEDQQRQHNDNFAVAAVGPARDRNAQRGVEDGKGQSTQQAQLRITEAEFCLDGREQHRQDHPVGYGQCVGQKQQHERASVAGERLGVSGRRLIHCSHVFLPERRFGFPRLREY